MTICALSHTHFDVSEDAEMLKNVAPDCMHRHERKEFLKPQTVADLVRDTLANEGLASAWRAVH